VGAYEVWSGLQAIYASLSGAVLTPLVINNQPRWGIYQAFQVAGILAGFVIFQRLRLGVALSIAYQALQLFQVTIQQHTLALASAFTLCVNLAIGPGTVESSARPYFALSINVLAAAIGLLLLVVWRRCGGAKKTAS
jgi:hypothetical protein